jgi:hypothetical protein
MYGSIKPLKIKYLLMKSTVILFLFIFTVLPSRSQSDDYETLRDLEEKDLYQEEPGKTATLTSATRLFGDRNDLTSVIMIIPSGSVVSVLGYDSIYMDIIFQDYEGSILSRHAVINDEPVELTEATEYVETSEVAETVQQLPPVEEEQPVMTEDREVSNRFAYLEDKYGSNMAARLLAGKIWKGMNAEMVRDSWGDARKTNRVISGNTIKEEWIYRNTWLYFENNTLVEWGPIER